VYLRFILKMVFQKIEKAHNQAIAGFIYCPRIRFCIPPVQQCKYNFSPVVGLVTNNFFYAIVGVPPTMSSYLAHVF
jgi:hypothetical protein